MTDQTLRDNTLETYLNRMESGEALDQMRANAGTEDPELSESLRLAAAIRKLEHPRLEARANPSRYGESGQASQSRWRLSEWLLRPKLTFASLAVFVLFLSVVFLLTGNARAEKAAVGALIGTAEVRAGGEGETWTALRSGDELEAGQVVRTGASSSLVVRFTDGSLTSIGPNSEISLEVVASSGKESIRVILFQHYGTTAHQVAPAYDSGRSFIVKTPSGSATVLGTTFAVAVRPDGLSRFDVRNGKVKVSSDTGQVELTSGQATTILNGDSPEMPGYQFNLTGIVEEQSPTAWVVSGINILLNEYTLVTGAPAVGDSVYIQGRILEDGAWLADEILAQESEPISSFSGIVDEMAPGQWVINGISIFLNEQTVTSQDIEVGDTVRVNFAIQEDHTWLALSINKLHNEDNDDPEETETPEPEQTPDPEATPDPEDEIDCTGANPHPKAVKLSELHSVTVEEIMGWFCQGYGFGEIELAYGLSEQSGTPVEEIFALREAGMGWGNIKKQMEEIDTGASEESLDKKPDKKTILPPGLEKKPDNPPGLENKPEKKPKKEK